MRHETRAVSTMCFLQNADVENRIMKIRSSWRLAVATAPPLTLCSCGRNDGKPQLSSQATAATTSGPDRKPQPSPTCVQGCQPLHLTSLLALPPPAALSFRFVGCLMGGGVEQLAVTPDVAR